MGKKIFRIFMILVLIASIAVFAVCAVKLVNIIIEYKKADDIYNDINKGIENMEGTDDDKNNVSDDTVPKHLVELSKYVSTLKEQYPDVVGYINIPSLGIKYPVVQTDNNDYYLDHLVTGEESSSGSIFVDARITDNPSSEKNFILYGHNMNDGSMFHKIHDLFEKENFMSAAVEYVTEDSVYIYTPFSIYRSEPSDLFYRNYFQTDEAYLDFCKEIEERNYHNESLGYEYDAAQGLITLCTCTNSITATDSRYIYHAMLTEKYENIHFMESGK